MIYLVDNYLSLSRLTKSAQMDSVKYIFKGTVFKVLITTFVYTSMPAVPLDLGSSIEEYVITFNKSDNTIRSETLLPFFESFKEAMQLIAKEIDLDDNLSIRVVAIEPGSFRLNVNFDLWRTKVVGLFSSENQKKVRSAVKTIAEIVLLMKLLQGDLPSDVINNADGSVLVVKNSENVTIDNRTWVIYQENNRVVDAIANQNRVLAEDEEIEGLVISDKSGSQYLTIDQEGLKDASIPKLASEDDVKYTTEKAHITIVRISFEKKLISTFIYKGKEISAKVVDEAFYDKVEKGARFGMGDVLEVEMQIKWVLDSIINQFIINKYEITKVISNKQLSPDSQLGLGF